MTQQPYPAQPGYPVAQQPYTPSYPQAPQQVQPQYPAPVQPGYPQAPVAPQYPGQPQQYGQPYTAQPQQPAQPLARGTLDDFFNQPSTGGGPSLSWTDKQGNPRPIGTTFVGVVARDVTAADVQQQTDFRTQAPLFYRDGRPKFAMKVPLKVAQSPEFPEGEAAWFVKGQAKDELQRAMAEAGATGSPKAGDLISIQLVQRRPSGPGMNPANVVHVVYQPAAQGTGAPSPAPVPQQQVQHEQQVQYQQPVTAPVMSTATGQPVVHQQTVPQPQQTVPQPQQAVQQAPVAPQQPAQQAPGGVQIPEGLDPERAALFAKLTGQQA